MNERIQKLALEAGKYADETQPLGSYTRNGMWLYAYNEKFAELIVKECIKFCEHESNDDEHDEYDMGMWVKAESIKTAIMKEFGIKE